MDTETQPVTENSPQQIADAILKGEIRAAAKLMREIDDGLPRALDTLKLLYPHSFKAQIWGITGSPGVGKSTLTDALVSKLRGEGKTVGVVAVDPTSPFSGGAILGDRVRMQRHATDDGVFIRSLATRGHFGGITASTRGVVTVMAAMGKDVVIIETVGVGQDEVDVVAAADTTLVVTVPGMGDDVQAIKAGILEVGDVFVVNKADRSGVEATVSQLEAMLAMERDAPRHAGWKPPVVQTIASQSTGLDDLLQAIAGHRDVLMGDDGRLLAERRRERARMEVMDILRARTLRMLEERLQANGRLEEMADAIAEGHNDPYTASETIMTGLF
jgi:LAO/AO transport system kinase